MVKVLPVSQTAIEECFKDPEDRYDIFIKLYKLIYPNWDEIKTISGFPKTSREVSEFIFGLYVKYDREQYPEFVAGGLWLNKGWSADDEIKGWVVLPAEYE